MDRFPLRGKKDTPHYCEIKIKDMEAEEFVPPYDKRNFMSFAPDQIGRLHRTYLDKENHKTHKVEGVVSWAKHGGLR